MKNDGSPWYIENTRKTVCKRDRDDQTRKSIEQT